MWSLNGCNGLVLVAMLWGCTVSTETDSTPTGAPSFSKADTLADWDPVVVRRAIDFVNEAPIERMETLLGAPTASAIDAYRSNASIDSPTELLAIPGLDASSLTELLTYAERRTEQDGFNSGPWYFPISLDRSYGLAGSRLDDPRQYNHGFLFTAQKGDEIEFVRTGKGAANVYGPLRCDEPLDDDKPLSPGDEPSLPNLYPLANLMGTWDGQTIGSFTPRESGTYLIQYLGKKGNAAQENAIQSNCIRGECVASCDGGCPAHAYCSAANECVPSWRSIGAPRACETFTCQDCIGDSLFESGVDYKRYFTGDEAKYGTSANSTNWYSGLALHGAYVEFALSPNEDDTIELDFEVWTMHANYKSNHNAIEELNARLNNRPSLRLTYDADRGGYFGELEREYPTAPRVDFREYVRIEALLNKNLELRIEGAAQAYGYYRNSPIQHFAVAIDASIHRDSTDIVAP